MTEQLTVVQEQSLVFENKGEIVTDSLVIAEMFKKTHDNVLKDIRKQIEYAGEEFSLVNFYESKYQKRGKEYPKYNLTEEAFTLVAMSYNTKEAVQMKIKFIQEFKRMKEYLKKKLDTKQLSPELQMFNQMFTVLANQEIEQKRLSKEVTETKEKVENISEIVALNTTDWRKDVNRLLNRIAIKQGGYEMYKTIKNESYDMLDQRAGSNLQRRLTNKQKNMALEGVSKSRINKVSKLDVIGEDKKLLEIYLAVVKDMAFKYQVQAL
ncbi:Rha family transcriptional regulator [Bacillus thuringiensis]|uniref:Antirepressor n=1 Tax=Bacillus thuringiensis subsp. tolworthi TaxID=1442 RepID=A0A9W4A047_BACTO|nr:MULTISPECIES: Rha family transcriptional regulator [Bacillus cereus group]MEB8715960.1 Rha family transcriptional regulator [Bacillus cereus]MED2074829.1 Rha family transcriptional regulator [Bacillus thuringiensis]KIP27495.1 phage regulatory, Rha family protein [Bacillus thuringiensis serovar morrisoni]MEB9430839.1 Rha family transcriptional regulator [Bacillus cereus]MEB9478140.1 Rha family transcriptional regulator [Bacillus cereus]